MDKSIYYGLASEAGLLHYLDPTDGLRSIRMDLAPVWDCMGANLGKFPTPKDVIMAGYITGSGAVPWTADQLAGHPDAIKIDQWPVHTPAGTAADWIDVENGAVPISEVAERYRLARAAYDAGTWPGQREPAIYVEESELTPVANALAAAGHAATAKIVLTKPMDAATAADLLNRTGGPLPFVAIQYEFNQLYDVSLVSVEWLNTRSSKPRASKPGPGTQTGWKFCRKCQGLFWGPGESISHCPVGAQHDGSASHEYNLGFTQ
jgi:hypothetical protein